MAQGVGVPVLANGPILIPSSHTLAHNHPKSSWELMPSSDLRRRQVHM